MPGKVLVGTIRGLHRSRNLALGRGIAVEMSAGGSAWLDLESRWGAAHAEILEELKELGAPAYLEADPETNVVNVVLIPLIVKISEIRASESGDLQIEAQPSAALHILRRRNPSFERFLAILEHARARKETVLLTETQETHELVDVRPGESPDAALNPYEPAAEPVAPAAFALRIEAMRAVTRNRAGDMFDLVDQQSCDPSQIVVPCIPFMYPDDGCWARADEMCRLISQAGEDPGKVWIYRKNGNLKVNTKNHPHCKVEWTFHVAPILTVSGSAGNSSLVIDPSLFDRPVSESRWKAEQHDPAATLVETDASPYLRSVRGHVTHDTTGAKRTKELAVFRLRLKLRSASVVGPPPYANC